MKERTIVIQAYTWLLIPVMLFIGFWFTPVVSVPVMAALLWSVWRFMVKDRGGALRSCGYSDVEITRKYWLILVAVALYIVSTGIGGFIRQLSLDHEWRNAVLFDLTRRDWPVVYESEGTPLLLCYYFALWLPSAFVAKFTGGIMVVADVLTYLYALWGTWIALGFVFSMSCGRALWSSLIVFIFFNAWDLVTAFIFINDEVMNKWGENYLTFATTTAYFSASANPILYYCVYNQGIAAWVFTMLFMHQRHKTDHLLFLLSLFVIFAPFPALAFIPYVAYRLLREVRHCFTVANITGFAICLLTSAFLMSNNNGRRLHIVDAGMPWWCLLLESVAFYAISFGPFLLFVWKKVRHSLLFWSLMAMAVLSALFRLGESYDLAWRVGVPATVMVCSLLAAAAGNIDRGKLSREVAFWAVMAVGAFSSVIVLEKAVEGEVKRIETKGERKWLYIMGRLHKPKENWHYNNFISEGNSFYSKHLLPSWAEAVPDSVVVTRRVNED